MSADADGRGDRYPVAESSANETLAGFHAVTPPAGRKSMVSGYCAVRSTSCRRASSRSCVSLAADHGDIDVGSAVGLTLTGERYHAVTVGIV